MSNTPSPSTDADTVPLRATPLRPEANPTSKAVLRTAVESGSGRPQSSAFPSTGGFQVVSTTSTNSVRTAASTSPTVVRNSGGPASTGTTGTVVSGNVTASSSSATKLESWAVVALAVTSSNNTLLLQNVYRTSPEVLAKATAQGESKHSGKVATSGHYNNFGRSAAADCTHLYVGEEDVIKIHLLLFSSIDRCNEVYMENKNQYRAAREERERQLQEGNSNNNNNNNNSTVPKKGGPSSSFIPSRVTSTTANTVTPSSDKNNNPKAEKPVKLDLVNTNPYHLNYDGNGVWSGSSGANNSNKDPRFLGKLIEGSRFSSFGFVSASRIKVVLITVGNDLIALDAVAPLCRLIYDVTSAAVSNPFFSFTQPSPYRGTSGGPSTLEEGEEKEAAHHRKEETPQWPRPALSVNHGRQATVSLESSASVQKQIESLLDGFTVTSRSRVL